MSKEVLSSLYRSFKNYLKHSLHVGPKSVCRMITRWLTGICDAWVAFEFLDFAKSSQNRGCHIGHACTADVAHIQNGMMPEPFWFVNTFGVGGMSPECIVMFRMRCRHGRNLHCIVAATSPLVYQPCAKWLSDLACVCVCVCVHDGGLVHARPETQQPLVRSSEKLLKQCRCS